LFLIVTKTIHFSGDFAVGFSIVRNTDTLGYGYAKFGVSRIWIRIRIRKFFYNRKLEIESCANLVQGHGAPVDILDAQCRSWQQCKRCVEIDSAAEVCDWEEGIIYEIGFDPIRFRIDCQDSQSVCGKRLCEAGTLYFIIFFLETKHIS